MKLISRSAAETKRLGAKLARRLEVGDVVLLRANLGAGKTTLVQGLVRALGVKDAALSPTFIVAQTYASRPPVHHLDFYRLSAKEILDMGVQDYLMGGGEIPRGLVLIEWPERCRPLWPADRLEIKIAIRPKSETREITLAPVGQKMKTRFKGFA